MDERGQIVLWLRAKAKDLADHARYDEEVALEIAADEIEAGEHLNPPA